MFETDALHSFDPLDRATLQGQAYDQLRRAVMGGVFKPGTAITIRAAAEALGVSPMPVRAALQRLETEGALVARGSKRTLAIPDLTAREYAELRDIRVLLEGLAVERAVSRIDAAGLATVEANCQAMQDASEAGEREGYVQTNWIFHRSLYQASEMPTLLALIEGMWLRVGPYVLMMMPDRDSLLASMPDHWAMVDAFRRRDGAGARQAIADDIHHSAVNLIKVLDRR